MQNTKEKETQILLAHTELKNIKQQAENAETNKVKVLSELKKCRATFEDLTKKLEAVNDSKQSSIEAAEAVKNKSKNFEEAKKKKAVGFEAWKKELEDARLEYTTTTTELDEARQELNKLRQEFDAALVAKQVAFQRAGEAQRTAKASTEKMNGLSEEIKTFKESIAQLKLDAEQAQEEKTKILEEKTSSVERFQTAKEEVEKKLMALKERYDPEETQNLQLRFDETTAEIKAVKEDIEKLRASEANALKDITTELNEARRALEEVAKEESSARNLATSLTLELENLNKEHEGLKKTAEATETLTANANAEQLNIEGNLISKEEKEAELSDEQDLQYQQLSAESEESRKEAEEMISKAEELRRTAEAALTETEDTGRRLQLVTKELEDSKAAEKRILDEKKVLTEQHANDATANPESGWTIDFSADKLEPLRRKIKESAELAEKTETESIAQVDEIDLRKNEVDEKIEANLKAIEEIEVATELALKNAETAESARKMVEGELNKWRQKEQKVAEEASSKIWELSNRPSAPNSLI